MKKRIKIIVYSLISLYILSSLILIINISNNNSNLKKEMDLIKKENDRLFYENDRLSNENDRLGMLNDEIWEFVKTEFKFREGENNE